MYFIVDFVEKNLVEIVPHTWIIGDNKCLWPPQNKDWPASKISKLVKQKSEPEECFATYNVRVLGTADSLLRAHEKLNEATYTSDINTDVEVNAGSGRPQRKQTKRKWFDMGSDETSDEDSARGKKRHVSGPSLPPPPALVSHTPEHGSSHTPQSGLQTPEHGSRTHIHSSRVTPLSKLCIPEHGSRAHSASQSPQRRSNTPEFVSRTPQRRPISQMSLVSQRGRPQLLENVSSEHMSIRDLLQLNAAFHKQILRTLNQLRVDVNQLQKGSGVEQGSVLERIQFPFILPVENDEEFNKIEQFLLSADNKKALAQSLQIIGGSQVDDEARSIMCHFLSNRMASKFSYTGRKGKISFQKLQLHDVIFGFLERKYPGKLTKAGFKKTVGDWLRYAPTRTGGPKYVAKVAPTRVPVADMVDQSSESEV